LLALLTMFFLRILICDTYTLEWADTLAAATTSAASQWARSGERPYANRLSPRVGRFINAAGTTGFPTGKRAV